MKSFFQKTLKILIWAHSGHFCPNWGKKRIFEEKRVMPLFQYSNYLPLCQKSENNNESFLRKLWERHTKNQFISLIFLWDTANSRVLRLIEKSCNLIAQEHFWLISLEPKLSEIWNLFKCTRITVIQTFIIDQTYKKKKELSKKLNFPMHSKNPGLGLFSPFWVWNIIFKNSGCVIHNTTWAPYVEFQKKIRSQFQENFWTKGRTVFIHMNYLTMASSAIKK